MSDSDSKKQTPTSDGISSNSCSSAKSTILKRYPDAINPTMTGKESVLKIWPKIKAAVIHISIVPIVFI